MLSNERDLFSILLMLMMIIGQSMAVSYASTCDMDMNQMDMNQMDHDDNNINCCDNSICTANCNLSYNAK